MGQRSHEHVLSHTHAQVGMHKPNVEAYVRLNTNKLGFAIIMHALEH